VTRRGLALALCAAALAGGCGPAVKTHAYAVYAEPRANDTSPVPVEFVVAYDDELVKVLSGLTARDWYRQRAQLRQDNPRGLHTVAREFVPGQSVPLQSLHYSRRGAKGAFVFADYYTPGEHRVRVDPFRRILLRLGVQGFTVEQT
jgi:type VI secretion system protein